ncbi:MAG: putative N6-adenine-specific DNA methylase [Saprospiraceae bacterium]|jgi:putative N6-adenine-specific DNA methylase
MKLTATTSQGLEEILADELVALGASNVFILKRAVEFTGDKKLLYRACYELRTAIRVLMPIEQFRVRHESGLYSKIKKIDWSTYMGVDDTLAINGVANSEYFNHSKYVALKSKDAIVDQFRDKFGRRPNVDVTSPTLRINVHINEDLCTVSLDASGESLHHRGYRREALEAPINEVLAAGMILLSGWKKDCDFIDPMCGSGTLLMEAGMIASNIPPQKYCKHKFGFENWKDFEPALWEEVKKEAHAKIIDFPHRIIGYDQDFKAIRVTERNLMDTDLEGKIEVERQKFEKLEPPSANGFILTNPPYEERIKTGVIDELYAMIGERLKHHFPGYTAWLISSNMEALKKIGLRPTRKITLHNGPLLCKFLKFEMYEGSKKNKD